MTNRVCTHCRCAMKEVIRGIHRCGVCGIMWSADRGYYWDEPGTEYYLAEAKVQGVTVFIPKAKKTGEQVPESPIELEIMQPNPVKKQKAKLIYGGIYFVRNDNSVGQEIRGSRPAIIVSDVSEIDGRDVVTVVYLTKRDYPSSPVHIRITSTGKLATALIEQVTTVDVSRIGDFMGMSSVREIQEVKKGLAQYFRLSSISKETLDQNDYIRQLESDLAALKSQHEKTVTKYENIIATNRW